LTAAAAEAITLLLSLSSSFMASDGKLLLASCSLATGASVPYCRN
jgi:hypothetical protein